jgi:hypothetical protein
MFDKGQELIKNQKNKAGGENIFHAIDSIIYIKPFLEAFAVKFYNSF